MSGNSGLAFLIGFLFGERYWKAVIFFSLAGTLLLFLNDRYDIDWGMVWNIIMVVFWFRVMWLIVRLVRAKYKRHKL